MPSGAKKRKAAKKKLQKEAHNNPKSNGSHSSSQGSDDPKGYDERERNVEDEGVKGVNLGEGNVSESKRPEEGSEVAREFRNGNSKSSSSSGSSSSSSSDEDEVVVEKEKPAEAEEVKQQDESTTAVSADSVVEDSVEESVEESIPLEESVKQVVSLPQESTVVSESVPVENLNVIESALKQNVDGVLQAFEDKTKVASGVIESVQEKIEEKLVPVVQGGSESTLEPVGVTSRDDEVSLPQSSGVKAVEESGQDNNGSTPETHKYAEEQPLISSVPVPVRRTSWMSCCGLFEVFSGDSSR